MRNRYYNQELYPLTKIEYAIILGLIAPRENVQFFSCRHCEHAGKKTPTVHRECNQKYLLNTLPFLLLIFTCLGFVIDKSASKEEVRSDDFVPANLLTVRASQRFLTFGFLFFWDVNPRNLPSCGWSFSGISYFLLLMIYHRTFPV